MNKQSTEDYIYIDNDADLQRYCQQWQQAELLALDTEFIRTDTFYPIAALIQLNDGTANFLIDPLEINDFDDFKTVLTSPAITKVLHSFTEDLEVFHRVLGIYPQPLIDTQVAAAIDGLGFSLGYQRLTEMLLGIKLNKGETRSNWLQRPLTDSQCHYAAMDVEHLPQMYNLLKTSLDSKGRWQWVMEECQQLLDQAIEPDDTMNYHKKIKSAWKLNREQLAVLITITDWREQQARALDRPRGRILKDHSCYEIARLLPRKTHQLANIRDVGYKTLQKRGDQILAMIEKALTTIDQQPLQTLARPLPPQTRNLMKKLKGYVQQQSEQMNIAPEMLVKKRDYETLVRSSMDEPKPSLPEGLQGWRQPVIGEQLLKIVCDNPISTGA